MSRRKEDEWSRTSPKNKRRGCLCKDGNTYSRECCNGNMINQGIGSLVITVIELLIINYNL